MALIGFHDIGAYTLTSRFYLKTVNIKHCMRLSQGLFSDDAVCLLIIFFMVFLICFYANCSLFKINLYYSFACSKPKHCYNKVLA